jgi:hypothetical protein
MRERIERIIVWASIVIGVLILGSCTIAGGSGWAEGDILKHPLRALAGAFAGILGGTLIVSILLGWIYAYFLLRRDLKSIHAEIEKLSANAPPGPAQR